MAISLYKVKQGIAPNYIKELFTTQNSGYSMRDNQKMVLPSFNTVTFGKSSARYLGAKLWNNIPVTIKNSVSLSTFKSAITSWLLTCRENMINWWLPCQFYWYDLSLVSELQKQIKDHECQRQSRNNQTKGFLKFDWLTLSF